MIEKDYLKNDLDVYKDNESFNDVNKLNNYIYALPVVTNEMIKLLERKEFERVREFADAVHNFPVFLVTDFHVELLRGSFHVEDPYHTAASCGGFV